jgi:hypothetical protein
MKRTLTTVRFLGIITRRTGPARADGAPAAPRDERWRERFSDIPRLIEGAVKLKAEGGKPKRGKSRPLRTNHSPRSASPTAHDATVRPY